LIFIICRYYLSLSNFILIYIVQKQLLSEFLNSLCTSLWYLRKQVFLCSLLHFELLILFIHFLPCFCYLLYSFEKELRPLINQTLELFIHFSRKSLHEIRPSYYKNFARSFANCRIINFKVVIKFSHHFFKEGVLNAIKLKLCRSCFLREILTTMDEAFFPHPLTRMLNLEKKLIITTLIHIKN